MERVRTARDALLAGAGIVSVLIVAVSLVAWNGLPPNVPSILGLIVGPGLVALVSGIVLRIGRDESKNVYFLCLLATATAAYLAEGYVAFSASTADARIDGGVSDKRKSISAVVADFRSKGVDAYPALNPRTFMSPESATRLATLLSQNSQPILPLGGIAAVKTAFCDEGGGVAVYDADEHGFRNPRGLWAKSPLDVVLIGDSYVQGACVDESATFAAAVREKFPNTLSLGMAGNGPVLNLATLREFGPSLKPKMVVWFFAIDNDFSDMAAESEHPILKRYLQSGFAQGVAERQEDIDRALKSYIDEKLMATVDSPSRPPTRNIDPRSPAIADWSGVKAFVTLNRLRNALGVSFSAPKRDYALLQAVLREAANVTASWGGKMLFVFLPSSYSYAGMGRFDRTVGLIKSRIRILTERLGMTFVDGQAALDAESHDDPIFYGLGSHYTPLGYRLIGRAVRDAL